MTQNTGFQHYKNIKMWEITGINKHRMSIQNMQSYHKYHTSAKKGVRNDVRI